LSKTVSVIIPTFNNGPYIAEAVESALAQTITPSEIVIVDDGSTDQTEAVVRQFGDKVRYIKQSNAGACSARNRGIAESNSEFIAFLDADDKWFPEKLDRQLVCFYDDSQIGLVHCGMREFNSQSGNAIGHNIAGIEGWAAHDILRWETSQLIGTGSTIIVRRSVIDDVGGFDEDLTHGEDWEFCLRVARKYKIGFVREALVDYRNHGSNVSKNIPEMERSTLLAWRKAFSVDDETIMPLRRRSYGNLYKVLAGSYLHYGDYKGFGRNVLKSLWYRPSYLGHYLRLLFQGRKN
jgi:glycosyltransferase involved in cell wall biosynthesis